MAKTAISTIKTWFETGDYPTQTQFWNWLDSFWHKDDELPTSQITDLDTLLAGKATTEETNSLQTQINNINTGNAPVSETYTANASYEIAEGKLLEKIVVMPTAALTGFGLGTGDGGFDIQPALPVDAGGAELFLLNIYAKTAKTIWFNGITSETTIKIYLR